MNNLHILSPGMEKQALSAAMQALSKRPDFLGGLAAPIVRLFGGGQKLVGNIQKAIPQIKNLNKPLSEIPDSPLAQSGTKNIAEGSNLRNLTKLDSIFDSSLPTQYRVGRGLGAAAVGAPLMLAPFSISEYAGAANADMNKVTSKAKQMAADRIRQRTEQYAKMPFFDRLKAVINPEIFSEQIARSSPELQDLSYAAQTGGLSNPGIMSYLASLNPFLSSPSEIIKQKTRAALSDLLKEKGLDLTKSGSVKYANKTVLEGLRSAIMPAWRLGRQSVKADKNLLAAVPNLIKDPNHTPIQDFLARSAYSVAKRPGKAALKGLAGVGIPYGMYASYGAGKQQVENQLAQDAAALADMQAIDTFNTPGFMGGISRLLAAIAPSMAANRINTAAGDILNTGGRDSGYEQSLYTA